jgi:hypothetical protein
VSKEDDGYYYLRSLNFDSLTDDNAVCECALELLEHMNGAAKFYSGESYRTVEFDGINQIDDKGKRHHFVYLSGTTEGRSKVPASFMVTREGDVAKPSQTPNEAESLVDLAEQDERVANTLRFFQKGDWINLYKAWEIVARYVAGGAHDVVKNGWATRDDQNRFTGTAQSRRELGDEARYASEDYKPPKKPMTLDEAWTFVNSVIEAWVQTL